MSQISEEAPTQPINNVNVIVQRERHWARNTALIAAGAAAVYLVHGCENADSPVRHGKAHVNPFSALAYIDMPLSVNLVRAEEATGHDDARIYVAPCTPKTPGFLPLVGNKQSCAGDIGWFNGDTGADVEGKLTVVASNKSMLVTAEKDDSKFGWHPVVLINKDRFNLEMDEPIYSSQPLDKGLGNSMKVVAQHKFHDPNADEADYMNDLEQKASNAVETACAGTMLEYVPASASKFAQSWLLGGVQKALQAKDAASSAWLEQLSKQTPHEQYLTNDDFQAMLKTVHTGKFVDPTELPSPTSTKVSYVSPVQFVRSPMELTSGISVEVPAALKSPQTTTFTIMLGTKKFTDEIYTDSKNCQLSERDQFNLTQLKASGQYVVDHVNGGNGAGRLG